MRKYSHFSKKAGELSNLSYRKRPNVEDMKAAVYHPTLNPNPVPISIYRRDGSLRGRAILLERVRSNYIEDDLPYILQEKKNDYQEPTCIVWSFQRWKIKWAEHPRLEDKTDAVEVHYFLKMTSRLFSDTLVPAEELMPELKEELCDIDDPVLFVDLEQLPLTVETMLWLDYLCKELGFRLVVPQKNHDLVKADHHVANLVDDYLPPGENMEKQAHDYAELKEIDNYAILNKEECKNGITEELKDKILNKVIN